MRTARTFFFAILAIVFLPVVVLAGRGDDLVHPTLIADVSAIQPGTLFHLGIPIKIDPTWHIYWTNAGESGLPTRVKLDLPPGFTAGDVQFPIPKKLVLPGDIVNFGYQDEVMLIVPITPPKDLAVGSNVTINGKITWLVCQEMCLPGKAEVLLQLPVASPTAPANVEAFDRWRKMMPTADANEFVTAPSPQNVADMLATTAKHRHYELKLTWKQPATDVDWFPDNNDPASIQKVSVQTRDGSTLLGFEVQAGDAPALPKSIRSLLVFTDSTGQRRGVVMNVPLPIVWDGNMTSPISK